MAFEKYRRLKRKVRFLYKRGTLFHAKPKGKPFLPTDNKPAKKKKAWRPFRKIRYLLKRGSLLKLKDPVLVQKAIPLPVVSTPKKHSGFNFRITYRKIRFLVNTGRLWKRKAPEKAEIRKKRRTLRKIRYLLYRGNLFKNKSRKQGKTRSRFFEFLYDWDYIKIIINSTVLFLLAYLFIFLVLN